MRLKFKELASQQKTNNEGILKAKELKKREGPEIEKVN